MHTYLVTLRFHSIKEPGKFSTSNFKVTASDPEEAVAKAKQLRAARSLGSVTLGDLYQYPDHASAE